MAHAFAGKEQLELLSHTTVLVSTIGSRSFRMALLPDGAQVCLRCSTRSTAT